MKLDALPNGESVFIDANIFVYHFGPDPLFGPPCSRLFDRVERQELDGITSTHVLTESAHRLMAIEASVRFGWPFAGAISRLRKHPGDVRQLTAFRTAVEAVVASRIKVVTVSPAAVVEGTVVSQQTGLLSNDALTVALMRQIGLSRVASNDADFDRVAGLTRYTP